MCASLHKQLVPINHIMDLRVPKTSTKLKEDLDFSAASGQKRGNTMVASQSSPKNYPILFSKFKISQSRNLR